MTSRFTALLLGEWLAMLSWFIMVIDQLEDDTMTTHHVAHHTKKSNKQANRYTTNIVHVTASRKLRSTAKLCTAPLGCDLFDVWRPQVIQERNIKTKACIAKGNKCSHPQRTQHRCTCPHLCGVHGLARLNQVSKVTTVPSGADWCGLGALSNWHVPGPSVQDVRRLLLGQIRTSGLGDSM